MRSRQSERGSPHGACPQSSAVIIKQKPLTYRKDKIKLPIRPTAPFPASHAWAFRCRSGWEIADTPMTAESLPCQR